MTVPLPLETERLELRAFTAGDVEPMGAVYGDAEVMCLEAAFAHLPHARVVALIEPGNDRSLELAERLGRRRVDTVEAHGRPHLLYAVERP